MLILANNPTAFVQFVHLLCFGRELPVICNMRSLFCRSDPGGCWEPGASQHMTLLHMILLICEVSVFLHQHFVVLSLWLCWSINRATVKSHSHLINKPACWKHLDMLLVTLCASQTVCSLITNGPVFIHSEIKLQLQPCMRLTRLMNRARAIMAASQQDNIDTVAFI